MISVFPSWTSSLRLFSLPSSSSTSWLTGFFLSSPMHGLSPHSTLQTCSHDFYCTELESIALSDDLNDSQPPFTCPNLPATTLLPHQAHVRLRNCTSGAGSPRPNQYSSQGTQGSWAWNWGKGNISGFNDHLWAKMQIFRKFIWCNCV